MAIYRFAGPSPTLLRSANGLASRPGDLWIESNSHGAPELLRLGIRSEARMDLRFAEAGEILNTQTGEVVAVTTARGDRVFLIDVGNGSQNLKVIGTPGSVSGFSAAQAASQPTAETAVSLSGVTAETAVDTVIPLPSAGPQAVDAELSSGSTMSQEEYQAALMGGSPGAYGAAQTATYGTVEDAVPVYEPPPEYLPEPVYEQPVYYPPPEYAEAPYTPGAQGYDEWAQTQTDLEQLVVMGLY